MDKTENIWVTSESFLTKHRRTNCGAQLPICPALKEFSQQSFCPFVPLRICNLNTGGEDVLKIAAAKKKAQQKKLN